MDEEFGEVAIKAYLFQVREQCSHVLISRWLMQDPLGGMTWFGISGLLTAAGNISKCLWGQSGSREAERAPLRERIGVDQSSPLRLTDMRNHFEHIDQRIEGWLKRSEAHNFADLNVGVSVSGLTSGDTFRAYDPGTGIVSFGDETYDTMVIVQEVARIFPTVQREAMRPRLGPPPPGATMPPPRPGR